MTTKTTAKRIAVGERIVTTAGVREVLAVRIKVFGGWKVRLFLSVQDPSSPTGATEIEYSPDSKVERVGVTAATLAKRQTR